jgi:hypothetical protein
MTATLAETKIADGIKFSLALDTHIRIYSLQTFSSRAIDLWIDHVITGLAHCSPVCGYRIVYDFSDVSLYGLKAFRTYVIGSLGMTTIGQERVRKIMAEKPQMTVKLAILTHPTLSARVIKKTTGKQIDVPFKFFLGLERAQSWLKSEDTPHV